MPASARTNIGIPPSTAFNLIQNATQYENVRAFFIAEAGPALDDFHEMRVAGKFQAYCVLQYIQQRLAFL